MDRFLAAAREVIARCQLLSAHTEDPGTLTRTFLSEPMRSAYADVQRLMEQAEMAVKIDAGGNVRGCYAGRILGPRLIIGSHLDTVPHAGMFDGPLGVMLGIELIRILQGRKLSFPVEVIGFSEEEGVRFGVPFIGSRALVGGIDAELLERRDGSNISVRDAIQHFGLDPSRLDEACLADDDDVIGFLEFHIEQGPVLESLDLPLGIVESIVGQSRVEVQFTGHANHAGTTPMHLRRDALAGSAEWILAVEREASSIRDLVATVGRADVKPGAGNVIPGLVTLGLDLRHADDRIRHGCVDELLRRAEEIAVRRRLSVSARILLDQPAVAMNIGLTDQLALAVGGQGYAIHRMNSGAGHDAMIMARRVPTAMLFLRSPGGISHHPDEAVLEADVAAALASGMALLEQIEANYV